MNTTERAHLARMVIGEERRERLITRYADQLTLKHGMPPNRATRYAVTVVDDASTAAILAVGQVWTRPDSTELPGDTIREWMGRTHLEHLTVRGFGVAPGGQQMVVIDDGAMVAYQVFDKLWLTAWPDEYTLQDEPQPPDSDLAITVQNDEAGDSDGDGEDAGEQFDPRAVCFSVDRAQDGDSYDASAPSLPLIGDHYRAINYRKPEYEPSYIVLMDAVAYIDEHLDDFRAAWPDYRDRWDSKRGFFGAFNVLANDETDGPEDYSDEFAEFGVVKAAYLGWWLRQRVWSDAANEHGGTTARYEVLMQWAPAWARKLLRAAPYADPEWPIPADHRLAQCDGQTALPVAARSSE